MTLGGRPSVWLATMLHEASAMYLQEIWDVRNQRLLSIKEPLLSGHDMG